MSNEIKPFSQEELSMLPDGPAKLIDVLLELYEEKRCLLLNPVELVLLQEIKELREKITALEEKFK